MSPQAWRPQGAWRAGPSAPTPAPRPRAEASLGQSYQPSSPRAPAFRFPCPRLRGPNSGPCLPPARGIGGGPAELSAAAARPFPGPCAGRPVDPSSAPQGPVPAVPPPPDLASEGQCDARGACASGPVFLRACVCTCACVQGAGGEPRGRLTRTSALRGEGSPTPLLPERAPAVSVGATLLFRPWPVVAPAGESGRAVGGGRHPAAAPRSPEQARGPPGGHCLVSARGRISKAAEASVWGRPGPESQRGRAPGARSHHAGASERG